MGHQEAGDGTTYPASFMVPDDGDAKTASSVNVAFEALADRTAYLAARTIPRHDDFPVSGTWTAPANCTEVEIVGYGAGGAGGGATPAGTVAAASATGGGGGGGAQRKQRTIEVVSGVVYIVTIGPASVGGIASTPGDDGASTTFGALATFAGGGGGTSSVAAATAIASHTLGGGPVPMSTTFHQGRIALVNLQELVNLHPGAGGAGLNNHPSDSSPGTQSVEGYAGGPGTSKGIDGGGYKGGGPGGGGGAGPGGFGGAGGAGAPGVNGPGNPGNEGDAAAANSGAGGGGGGAGGQGTSAGAAGLGGAGGSGMLTIKYYGPQAVRT